MGEEQKAKSEKRKLKSEFHRDLSSENYSLNHFIC